MKQEIKETIIKRNAHTEGDQLWKDYNDRIDRLEREKEQLRKKEEQLRTEKELLLKKEERLCEELKAIKQDRAGE